MLSKKLVSIVQVLTKTFCLFFISNLSVNAQIIAEDTLGKKISIESKGDVIEISGGASSVNNLFHSFLEFNVSPGESVYFLDPGVKNIIAHVRQKRSSIDGILGVSGGSANLFLINPMGIVFGENAQLDLKGSFLASTADSIIFDDGSEFGFSSSSSPSLLTVNLPVGLRFGEMPGAIVNKSTVFITDSNDSIISAGLTVSPGKTIALIGGNLSIDGGFIYAPGARIELGSVSANSLLHLTPDIADWSSSYRDVQKFQDINIINGAIILTGQDQGGAIHLQGRQVNIQQGEIGASSTGATPGGNISIDASESLLLEDGSQITNGNLRSATASSGNIDIDTKSIIVRDSIIDASSDSSSPSGNITIKASESLNVDNSLITAKSLSGGKAGTLRLDVGALKLSNDAEVTVSSPKGGIAGDLEIKSNSLLLENQSMISASTTEGQVGNINIDSGNIILRENSIITTSAIESPSKTDGGNISIAADSLILENGNISANSTNSFGGRVNITAAGIFQSLNSSITATSEAGPQFNGIVNLDITNVDPTHGLTELPSYIVDPNSLVAQSPCRRGSRSEFTRSGRGGLPPNVSQDFNSDATQVALVTPASTSLDKQQTKPLTRAVESTTSALGLESPVVPAQGWVFNAKGEVVLVADNAVVAGPQRLKANPAGCPLP
jgi:filamentous hemagglutinin family protein